MRHFGPTVVSLFFLGASAAIAQNSGNKEQSSTAQGNKGMIKGGGNDHGNGDAVQVSIVYTDQTKNNVSAGVEQVKQCFNRMTSMARNYDPKYLDFINDDAHITYAFVMSDGTSKDVPVSAAQYKQTRKVVLLQQKAVGNRFSYSNVDINSEGSAYRVTGMVHYSSSGRTEHFSGLAAVDGSQNCHISEIKQTLQVPAGMGSRIPAN